MNSSVAVLLLHFKNSRYTLPCLNSLKSVDTPFVPYILSIQSQDFDQFKDHPLHPKVIETDINGGFAWANNLLIKQAIADGIDTFVLLNNDTTVTKNFLPPLISQLAKPEVGMVCPKIYFSKGMEFHHDSYTDSERGKVIWYMGGLIDWANVYASHLNVDEVDHGQFETVTETDFATGCCLAISKNTIDRVGLMDEKYFLYYEDADWSLKVMQAGLKILVEPKSVIYHDNAGSTNGSGSPLQVYYQTRNRYYFGMKFAPLRTKVHLLKNTLSNLKSSDTNLRDASGDALIGRMGIHNFR